MRRRTPVESAAISNINGCGSWPIQTATCLRNSSIGISANINSQQFQGASHREQVLPWLSCPQVGHVYPFFE